MTIEELQALVINLATTSANQERSIEALRESGASQALCISKRKYWFKCSKDGKYYAYAKVSSEKTK
jgi:hypothetical protein